MDIEIIDIKSFNTKHHKRISRAQEYYVLLLDEPDGTVDLDYFKHQPNAKSIFFISEGRSVKSNLNDEKGKVVSFTPHFLNMNETNKLGTFDNIQFNYFCHSPYVNLDQDKFKKFTLLFQQLRSEIDETNMHTEALKSILKLILINYQRAIKEHTYSNGAEVSYFQVIQLRKDIERFYKVERLRSFYAKKQNISAKRLDEITKKALGKTITYLIHERLILEAKNLLHLTDMSVKEIAYELGFSDPPYFYRFFKKHEGTSPEKIRATSK